MSDPLTLISNIRFHRRLKLETSYGRLAVSYADVGCPTGPVLLYLPGMFASRYLGIPIHAMAEQIGVRVLVIDRPGMGGSTDVPHSQRVNVWIDILPRVLSHVGISRVNLASHSAGTVYLLNTWARCRDLVGDVVGFFAPWVDPAHSRVPHMQMAQWIPERAFALWHRIPRFVVTRANSVLASSGVFMRQLSGSSGITTANSHGEEEEDEGNDSFLAANFRRMERDYAVSRGHAAELSKLAVRFMFAEETVGANGEALQCVRKGEGWDWGVCEDYGACARILADMERRQEGRKLTVLAYFAAKDALVGKKGQEYFGQCWAAPGVKEEIQLVSRVIAGSDHDAVAQSVEAWEEVLRLVRDADF
ncbi:alpha/beta fold hydrolase [Aspergillus lucknowensis]|uniref:Alpha/Beta hydrolase protein n=1 Tax=Aspergillus lucknowensis TaxID=176173 RepID=A0ABR4LTA6_9EURO